MAVRRLGHQQALASGLVSSDELELIFVVLDEPRLLTSRADVQHALAQLDREVEAIECFAPLIDLRF